MPKTLSLKTNMKGKSIAIFVKYNLVNNQKYFIYVLLFM
jgi:hypothetical protein